MATTKKTTSRKTTKSAGKTGSKSAATKTTAKKSQKADIKYLKRIKSTSWMAILESLVIGVLGLLLIFKANEMKMMIFYIIGIFLMVRGAYKIVSYFAMHGKYDFYNNDLFYGVIALILGIIAVVLWEQLDKAIGIIIGAWMIYGGLVRLNTAIKLQGAKVKQWFYVMILALIMMALGIYSIVSADAWSDFLGWIMVAAAVVGILDDILFMAHIDELAED